MLGIVIGLVASNASEWFMHKYVLHGAGRSRRSFWAFHWHEHHREARRHGMVDPNYEKTPFGVHAQGKELLGLVGICLLNLPLDKVAPFYTATVVYSAAHYYRVHKRAHQDPAWAREHLPWHYDHHMGPNADANWCVTRPWWDHVMGTREPYVGTEREARDLARKAAAKREVETGGAHEPETEPVFTAADEPHGAPESVAATA